MRYSRFETPGKEVKMSIGERIKARRIELGMTQEELADALYIKKSTISYYENNKIDIKGIESAFDTFYRSIKRL